MLVCFFFHFNTSVHWKGKHTASWQMFKKQKKISKKEKTKNKNKQKKVPASLGLEPAASYMDSQTRYLLHYATLTTIFGTRRSVRSYNRAFKI